MNDPKITIQIITQIRKIKGSGFRYKKIKVYSALINYRDSDFSFGFYIPKGGKTEALKFAKKLASRLKVKPKIEEIK
jgi:hypothetical protein